MIEYTTKIPLQTAAEFQLWLDIQPRVDALAERLKADFPYGITGSQVLLEAAERIDPAERQEVIRQAVSKVILDQTGLQKHCQCDIHLYSRKTITEGECLAAAAADADFQRRQEAWADVSFADRQVAYQRLNP